MKLYLIAFVLLALDPIGKLDRVAKQNALKKEAKAAFMEEDFKTAIEKYSYLHDSLNVRDDNILLNLATAQYKSADSAGALGNYQKLTSSADKNIRSVAYQQLGIMNNAPQQREKALDYFKKALKANPANEEARYNYELLKKLMQEQENQQDQQNNDDQKEDQQKEEKDQEKQEQEKDQQDQQQKDQQQQDQEKGDKQDEEQKDQQQDQQEQDKEQQEQSQEQQEGDEKKDKEQQEGQAEQDDSEGKKDEKEEIPPATHKKLQEMKISPEKAKMILEAMRNQEVQYIQQNKKKARNRAKNGKPDW